MEEVKNNYHKQFTNRLKNLTFTKFLDKNKLQTLESQKSISYFMLNMAIIDLSGQYYKSWTYSGKALQLQQQQQQQQQLQKSQTKLNHQSNHNKMQKQLKQKHEAYLHLQEFPFMKLIKRAEWDTVRIMLQKSQNKDAIILNELSCIQFPKLKHLVLIGNNINSVQIFQEMQFPNLQQLELSFNTITNAKSLQKNSRLNITRISLIANFLNSQRTFQAFTRINAPNLMYPYFQMQNNNLFLQDIRRHINIELTDRRRNRNINQSLNLPSIATLKTTQIQDAYFQFSQNQSVSELFQNYDVQKKQLSVEEIFYDYYQKGYKPVDIFNYLRRQQLFSLQYKFLLKTNSLKQEIFCNKPKFSFSNAGKKYSPYQYYIDYGTEIETFCQYISKDDLHEYVQHKNPKSPCILGLCPQCLEYRCKCEPFYEQKLHDKNKVRGKKGVNKFHLQ